MNPVVPLNALFAKPDLAISDPKGFEIVRDAILNQFSSQSVTKFLASIDGRKLRIRDFEAVLGRDLLGYDTRTAYEQLGNGDQGQIREFYLGSLERVEPALRQKFFKLYSYY